MVTCVCNAVGKIVPMEVKQWDKEAVADQHQVGAGEVVVVGVTEVEEGKMMYRSCLLLVSRYQGGVSFVEIQRTLQTPAQIAVGRPSKSCFCISCGEVVHIY